MNILAHVPVFTYIKIYIHASVRARTHAHTNTHSHTHTHTNTYTHTYTHTHTYIHTNNIHLCTQTHILTLIFANECKRHKGNMQYRPNCKIENFDKKSYYHIMNLLEMYKV